MTIRVFAVSNKAEVRNRLSRGSLLLQTSQLQPSTGTPLEVPVPRKVKTSPNPSKGGEGRIGLERNEDVLIVTFSFSFITLSSENHEKYLSL